MTVFLRRLVDISTDLSERKTLLFLVLWLFSDWVECLSVWHSPANSSRQSRMRRCGKGWLASNVESGKLKTPARESVELPLPDQHRIDMEASRRPEYSLFNLAWYVLVAWKSGWSWKIRVLNNNSFYSNTWWKEISNNQRSLKKWTILTCSIVE